MRAHSQHRYLWVWLLPVACLLSGCFNVSWFYQQETPTALRQYSDQLLAQLLTKQSAEILAQASDTARADGLETELTKLLSRLPDTPPLKTTWLRYNAVGPAQVVVSYELAYPQRWAQLSLLLTVEATLQLHSVQLNFADQSLASQNAFNLTGKSWLQYAFLFACLIMPLLVLATLWLVVRTPGLRFRWVWLLITLIALPVFNLNWTTGDWNMQWDSIRLAGMSYYRLGEFGPWVLSFGLPVGAILALFRTRVLARQAAQSDT